MNHVFCLQKIWQDKRIRRIDHRDAGVLKDVSVVIRRQWFSGKAPYAQVVLLHDDLLLALELNKEFERGPRKGAKCHTAVGMNLRRYERPGNRREIRMI